MRGRLVALLFSMAIFGAPAAFAAPWTGWDSDFDEQTKSWKEIQAQIPPYPKPGNLVPLEVGTASAHKFFIDASSVSLGEDGVMRYTAVLRTGGGATNVSFEGMRCETREQKLYALGHNDGTWVRARNPKWERVTLRELAPFRYMLFRDYFCASRTQPTPPRLALDALRRGTGLGNNNSFD